MSDLLGRIRDALANRYAVDSEIGRGGMAAVFLATDLKHDRAVAVKVMLPEVTSELGAERFLREIRVEANLNHPHILPLHDSGESADGLLYYVMPYVEGESLRQRLAREGRLPIADAVALVRQVALALDYAHKRGYVHRDIKPANLLLSSGYALVSDFGIAGGVMAAGGDRITRSGLLVGTPMYMAPEQVMGDGPPDGRSDQYALACVLFELLTGTPPFTGDTARAVLMRHAADPIPSARRLRAEIPESLDLVIGRALAKSADDRFTTMEEFAAALETEAAGSSAHELHGSSIGRLRGRGLAVAAILAVILVGLYVLRGRLSPETAYAVEDPRQSYLVLPFDVTAPDAASDWMADGAAHLLGMGLEAWDEIRVANPRQVRSLAQARQVDLSGPVGMVEAIEIARDARVGTLVLGDLTASAAGGHLSVSVVDVAEGIQLRDPILVDLPAGTDLRTAMDRVAGELLDLSGAPETALDLRAATTASITAYQDYVEGLRHLYRWELDDAIEEFEAALAIDTTFALAYHYLAVAKAWSGSSQVDDLTAAAVRHSTDLPERYRQHIAAFDATSRGDGTIARKLYGELLASDSTDAEAWFQLADVEYHDLALMRTADGTYRPARDPNTALRGFLEAVAIAPDFHLGYGHAFDQLDKLRGWPCDAFEAPDDLPDAQRPLVQSRTLFNEDTTFTMEMIVFCLAPAGDSLEWSARGEGEQAQLPEAMRIHYGAQSLALLLDWAAVAPTVEQPHKELRDLYLERRREAESREAARQWSRKALIAERARAGADGVLSAEDWALMGAFYLDIGWTDSLHAAIGRLRELAAPDAENDPASVLLVAVGRPEEALGWLGTRGTTNSRLPNGKSVTYPSRFEERVTILAASGREWDAFEAATDSLEPEYIADSGGSPESGWESKFLQSTSPSLVGLDAPALSEAMKDRHDTIPPVATLLSLAAGDTAGARRTLEAAAAEILADEWPHPPLSYAWSIAAARTGPDSLALALFDQLDDHRLYRVGWLPRWALLVRSYLERAKVYERVGDTEAAREYYELFLDHWRDPEPEVRYLADEAREGLARLGG